MDRVERRSAGLSLLVHGTVVVLAFVGSFRGTTNPPPPPTRDPVAAPERLPDEGAPIIPEAPAAARQVVLPTLAPAPVTVPLPDVRPGPRLSRGTAGTDSARIDLPAASSAPTPLHDALRGLSQVPPAQDRAEELRRDTARHLDFVLRQAFQARWREWRTRMTNRRLVLWLVTDANGRVADGGLFRCSTGVEELDRGIRSWLVEEAVGLPPIPAGVVHYVKVDLP